MKDYLILVFEHIRLLKPSLHNVITKLIVIAGIALIAPSFITQLASTILEEKLEIKIVNDYDPLLGLSLILIALIYNLLFHKIVGPTHEILALDFSDNSLWLDFEGSKRIELFGIHMELYELCEKKEFRETQRFYFQLEKILDSKQRFEVLRMEDPLKKAFDQFFSRIGLHTSNPFQSVGIDITVHYNTIGLFRRKHADFQRWLSKTMEGNFIIHKHSYHYEVNKPATDKIIDLLKAILKFITSPASEYRRISMMRIAQKKLDFEAYLRAYMNNKLTSEIFFSRLKKLIGIEAKTTKAELTRYAKLRMFYDDLPDNIKGFLEH